MEFKSIFDKVSNIVVDTGKQVGSLVSDKAREAKDYAKDAMEISNLKGQIATCEESLKAAYQTLGEYYYKIYADNPAAEVVESVRAIDNAQETIKELQAKIDEIKEAQIEVRAAKAAAAEDAAQAKAEGVVADVDAEIIDLDDIAAAQAKVDEAVDNVTEAMDAVDRELDEIKPE